MLWAARRVSVISLWQIMREETAEYSWVGGLCIARVVRCVDNVEPRRCTVDWRACW